MEGYVAPQSPPPVVADPVRSAAHDGYVTLITTLLPILRTGLESRPGELAAGWRQLSAAVEGTHSNEAKLLLATLPERPAAGDLAPLTQELARIAGIPGVSRM